MKPLTGKRAARTRQSLMTAGFNLLMDKPIDALSINEIVSVAGVAKGSFFNHFIDKDDFATAIATEVRSGIELQISAMLNDVDDPVLRLASGMQFVSKFALLDRKRTIAMLHSLSGVTWLNHPFNNGVKADIAGCVKAGLVRAEAEDYGVLFWLGLCHVMMTNIVEQDMKAEDAAAQLDKMLVLGLTGLGVDEATACKIGGQFSMTILQNK